MYLPSCSASCNVRTKSIKKRTLLYCWHEYGRLYFYIELVTLGTFQAAIIEPMNVYRVAVMKNANRIIALHNHPSGRLDLSEDDKDITN